MRSRVVGAAVVLAALAALLLQTGVMVRTGFLMGDFRAFYCAARVSSTGANPYHTQPLRACELSTGAMPFFRKNPNVTIPAPLPGYVVAAMIPLSLLPFVAAAILWGIVLFAACVAATLAVFGVSLATLSLPFGEVVPIAVACACGAAYFALRGRIRLAAVIAAGAMIEPHLGLPVCVAFAIWQPVTRLPLAIVFSGLAVLSLAVLGPATNVEYFTSVLPSHALSEMTRDTQYSFTAVLAAFGVPAGAAVRGGTLWYALMLVAGVIVAGILARKTRNAAFLACVPLAFAVFGGTFIHVTQIAAAVPAAVLLIPYVTGRTRTLAIATLLLLAVPWGWAISPALIVAPVFPVAFVAWWYWRENTYVLLAALAACALVFGLGQLYTITGLHFGAHPVMPLIDSRLPEASWSAFSQGASHGSLAAWAVRIPTWLGLASLLMLLLSRCLPEQSNVERVQQPCHPELVEG
ncbi:MAG TPA: glycosyltransferase family 87 protein [Candidatus Nitrosotalea sp.]|nr:glycosyltransferase family 87 protein [Candidatus Nitrosotalea sp.]